MNILSCAASILKMLEAPSSSTYQALIHLLKISQSFESRIASFW